MKHCKLNQISVSEHSALYEDKRLKYQKTFKLFRKWFDDAMVQVRSDFCSKISLYKLFVSLMYVFLAGKCHCEMLCTLISRHMEAVQLSRLLASIT